MNKSELIEKLAQAEGITMNAAEQAVNIVLKSMEDALVRESRLKSGDWWKASRLRRTTDTRGEGPKRGKADVSKRQLAFSLGNHKDLYEQSLNFIKESSAEIGNSVMIGVESASDESEGNGLIGGFLNFSRAEYPCCISIEKQTQDDLRSYRLSSYRTIPAIDPTEIQLRNGVDNKSGQMIGRQAVSYRDDLFESGFIVGCFEFPRHTLDPLTRAKLGWQRIEHFQFNIFQIFFRPAGLSDRLLEPQRNIKKNPVAHTMCV